MKAALIIFSCLILCRGSSLWGLRFGVRDGPVEKWWGGEGGEKTKKKFMQGKMSDRKIHAQDGPHFDMKP